MYITRHAERVIAKMSERCSAVIVTGARQVGKTTLLKRLFSDLRYLSFDDADTLSYAVNHKRLFFKTYVPPLILDGVQYAPDIFPYIKMLVDEKQARGQFLMTGSQSFHLMKNVTESLAGRVSIVELLGLSLREIMAKDFTEPFLPTEQYLAMAKRFDSGIEYSRLWDIIFRGSLPRQYKEDTDFEFWQQLYRDYVRTYIERDVRNFAQIGDHRAFTQFMQLLAASTAQMLNYSKIAGELAVSVTTIRNWVSILEASGIIYLLQPYSSNISKRIVKTPKLYFLDTGLVAYLTGWFSPEQLQLGAMSGAFFETFVISEIIKSYQNAGLDTRLNFSYYRDKEQREIDLIIQKNNTLYPIEIKKTASPNPKDIKHFHVLEKETTKELGEGALICNTQDQIYLKDSIKAIPVTLI